MNSSVSLGRVRFVVILLTAVIALASASAPAEELKSDLELFPLIAGKNPEKVVELMGKPGRTVEEGKKIHWFYKKKVLTGPENEVSDWRVSFENGTVSDVSTGTYFE